MPKVHVSGSVVEIRNSPVEQYYVKNEKSFWTVYESPGGCRFALGKPAWSCCV